MTSIVEKLASLGIRPIYGQYLPLNDHDLSEVEGTLEAVLPDDYKAFIQTFGCAYFPEREVGVQAIDLPPADLASSSWLEIGALLGGGTRGHQLTRTLALMEGRLPSTMLPIANDHSGNLFCLQAGQVKRGTVHLWSMLHESDPESLPPSRKAADTIMLRSMTLVACSFEDFVARLKFRPGSDVERS